MPSLAPSLQHAQAGHSRPPPRLAGRRRDATPWQRASPRGHRPPAPGQRLACGPPRKDLRLYRRGPWAGWAEPQPAGRLLKARAVRQPAWHLRWDSPCRWEAAGRASQARVSGATGVAALASGEAAAAGRTCEVRELPRLRRQLPRRRDRTGAGQHSGAAATRAVSQLTRTTLRCGGQCVPRGGGRTGSEGRWLRSWLHLGRLRGRRWRRHQHQHRHKRQHQQQRNQQQRNQQRHQQQRHLLQKGLRQPQQRHPGHGRAARAEQADLRAAAGEWTLAPRCRRCWAAPASP